MNPLFEKQSIRKELLSVKPLSRIISLWLFSFFGTAICFSHRGILFSDIQLCWVATRSRQDRWKVGFPAMRLISNNPGAVLISVSSLVWGQQVGR